MRAFSETQAVVGFCRFSVIRSLSIIDVFYRFRIGLEGLQPVEFIHGKGRDTLASGFGTFDADKVFHLYYLGSDFLSRIGGIKNFQPRITIEGK